MSNGTTATPPLQPLDTAVLARTSPSFINNLRITAVMERLAAHLHDGNHNQLGALDFYNQCISLSRGIDYSLANGEISPKAKELPALMRLFHQRKNDELSQAALMVVMISVKNACELGWFQAKEKEELLAIADEVAKIFCNAGKINAGPSSSHSTITRIMERFYPKMKLGQILVSFEAKPGYGAYTLDFHITKSNVQHERIWLFVAQTDNVETSACLINPQQVNFLLNGKGVDRRTNVFMDTVPQMPTPVSGMLKYGTNLLQAVGQFTGHYVVIVAYMSFVSLPEDPVLQDYVQPAVTSVDTDSDLIEGASRISLNCPISFARIKTPVKGCSCKHFQCFDFDNFINMNSRRPWWRCPHCNQHVSYEDIRLDRNMVEILKDVGENILEVIVLGDGSWKAVFEKDHNVDKTVFEKDHNVDKTQNKAHNGEKKPAELQESTCSPNNIISNIFDLTNDDDCMDLMDTIELEDTKPAPGSAETQFVNQSSTSLGLNSTDVDQNVASHIDDEFWAGLDLVFGRSDTPSLGISENPVLPDSVSPAFNQGSNSHDNNSAVNSLVHNQVSTPTNLQLIYMNSSVNEYGRSASIPRHVNRTPVAVQALAAPSSISGREQSLGNTLNSSLPSSSPATTHVPLSHTATAANPILTDTERQQHFSRSQMNLPQMSGVNSLGLPHHSATQNRVPPPNNPAPNQLPNSNRPWVGLGELSNPHLSQSLNSRAHPVMRTNIQRSHIQQGGSVAQSTGTTANSQQTRANAIGQVSRDQRGSVTPQSVSRPDDLLNLQSEQNWRPTQRMRGSLTGRPYSDEVRERIIAPTQLVQNTRPQGTQPVPASRQHLQSPLPVQGSRPHGSQPLQRPQGPPPFRPTGLPLDVLIANNRNAHNHPSNA
ncbi:hypothetical protein HN51_068898 [Arachis hypogaea]|uniref:E4 SUMO-protein ligase PIAL2 n=1 Tax=Arachis ipaensis TaxID=130454 RepID=UPI0007AF9320|nr:E4 SUMO-protein ligase PIAL2 [Arachis ipaensis]XP_025653817.1 E4 SUMO-protein ligase PIAL2 [Arachis hypogaea]QHO11051.1 uncharacterized protein DS421_15g494820 [Arachis hypogaea]